MKSKFLSDQKSNEQLFFKKVKAEGLDKIYYSEWYIDEFFTNPLLNPTKLVIQPLDINQIKNLNTTLIKFKLGEEYQKPLISIVERIFTLGSFLNLIEKEYQSVRKTQPQLKKFLKEQDQPKRLKVIKYMKEKSVSVLIYGQGSMQKILGIISLKEKTLTEKIRPFGQIYSKTTTALCHSLFAYLQAIPLLDNDGNLLTTKDKTKLAGCILAAADWKILENNQQKTGYKQARVKVKFNLTDNYLNKIYKKVNSRITRSKSSVKLLK